jgi:putative salt-induced outer membrane protein YdiY
MKTKTPTHPNAYRTVIATVLGIGTAASFSLPAYGQDAAAPAPDEKKSKWESSAGVGLTLTQGNSESVTATASAVSNYKADKDEIAIGISAGYGEARPRKTDTNRDPEMEKNTEFLKAFGQYNRLFSDRLFGYGRVDALHDDISDVQYRVSLSPGVGYYFAKQPNFTLAGEVGPGYVFEKVGSTSNDYLSLRIAERLEWKFSDTARLWQSLEFVPEVEDFENYILTFELGVAAALTKKLELRVVFTDVYDSEPAVYPWGERYERNDIKVTASLNYKF